MLSSLTEDAAGDFPALLNRLRAGDEDTADRQVREHWPLIHRTVSTLLAAGPSSLGA